MKLHSGDFQMNLPIKACMETTITSHIQCSLLDMSTALSGAQIGLLSASAVLM